MPMDDTGVMQYRYGDHLDVKKVLSIQDDQSDACGLVNTRMDYLDSRASGRRAVPHLCHRRLP